NGVRIIQTAFETELNGTKSDGPVPAADTLAVFLAEFFFTNTATTTQTVHFLPRRESGISAEDVTWDDAGFFAAGGHVRGQITRPTHAAPIPPSWELGPGQATTLIVKIPYFPLAEPNEQAALANLGFEKEREAVAGYWRRRLDQSARLTTPEPM